MTIAFAGTPLRLGVITDIQYADKADTPITEPVMRPSPNANCKAPPTARTRKFCDALAKTEVAVKHLNESRVSATLHLGDIIDGNESEASTRAELSAVLQRLSTLDAPLLHVIGNHCLNVGRTHLRRELGLQKAYYSRDLSARWRLVVLDTLDVSVARTDDDAMRALAGEYLRNHEGEANAQTWNGMLGVEQIAWLRGVLADTRARGMLCVVSGHIPVYLSETEGDGGGEVPRHVMWDRDAFGKVLTDNCDIVKAYFAGHFHDGGYVFRDGVHFVTFESILDSQCEDGAWAVVDMFDDGIDIRGHGDMTSRQLKFPTC